MTVTEKAKYSKVEDLKNAAEKVSTNKTRMWILGTACKCHGILTAFEVNK